MADKDKNGYLDRDEFAELVTRLPQDIQEAEVSTAISGHIKTAAYASECHLCPPPLFLPLASLIQLSIFIYHTLHLASSQGRAMGWDGPAPLCSPLIFNPYLRYSGTGQIEAEDPMFRWQAWRYLSYSLVHSGYTHLVLNLAMQLAVGLPLEFSQGTIRWGSKQKAEAVKTLKL